VVAAAADGAAQDWKTVLQELSAGQALGVPEYRSSETGPDHAKTFRAVVHVGGQPRGEGTGPSKKQAEQVAAELAVRALSGPADPVAAVAGA
jgi:ribonuclease-3